MFKDDESDAGDPKSFRPSPWKWLKLVPQKVYSRKEGEDEDIEEMLEAMRKLRADLVKIRDGMREFIKCSKRLAKAAQDLSEALETDPVVLQKVNETLKPVLDDDKSLRSIIRKIKLMDMLLIKDTEKLRFIRLTREKAQRKLAALNTKNGPKEDKTQVYLKTIEDATREYDELLEKMMTVMTKQVKIAEDDGVTGLITPQLRQFRLNQFQLFLNYQRLISGKGDRNANDLEKIWTGFANQIGSNVEAEAPREVVPQARPSLERDKFASMLVKQQSYDDRYTDEEDFYGLDGSTGDLLGEDDSRMVTLGDIEEDEDREHRESDEDQYSEYTGATG